MVKNNFIRNGFKLIEEYNFNSKYISYVFAFKSWLIIIDDSFDKEESKEFFFDYSKYCEMQNKYMQMNNKLLRFNYDNNELEIIESINNIINNSSKNEYEDKGGFFSDSHIDNTPVEAIFENVFTEAYGNEALECLRKEVSISNGTTGNYFIDYVVETRTGNYAFEENGVNYHHPLIVGKKRYKELLDKQNAIIQLGYIVYRFSTDNLHFKDKIIEELRYYLPNKESFIPKMIYKNERGLELYSHQTDILKQLDIDRLNGKNTSLIVIPTASGKSEICITDLSKEYIKKSCKRILIMVPTTKVKEDWENRVKVIKDYYEKIDVLFYNTVFTHKNELPQDYYDYIIFDEAHHAQASNCKATIQYFNPKYLIGLTATDERLDNKKLQEIFGNYDVKLTLKEAIEKGVVTNIRAYRLESNINLTEVRYNGKDYNNVDLERNIIVNSRNELIAETIKKYFEPKENFYKQGIVFCVNKDHCQRVCEALKTQGITAEAVYGGNRRNEEIFENYKNKKVQILCSCQLISEGWDSPQTELIVMARPTLSKVLYLQQIGRGLRKYPNKECLYLIDVVDNYSSKLTPWSFNSLFHIAQYSPFMGVINNNIDYLTILGLSEHEMAMKEIDIFTFEEKYKDYLSLEQAARELYIGTNTLNKWNKDKKYASIYLPIGSKEMPYFSLEDIKTIREDRHLKEHTDETILDDFIEFTDDKTFTFSFKLVFLINCFKCADQEGNINLDDLLNEYKRFYISRIEKGLPVDKKNCIYTLEYLNDYEKIKKNMLDNPFEKFERKRFFYYSKDLNIISFNSLLWSKLNEQTKKDIIEKEYKFLKEYYEKFGGYDNEYKF
jgi:superfamily II DNA or RNA helicase